MRGGWKGPSTWKRRVLGKEHTPPRIAMLSGGECHAHRDRSGIGTLVSAWMMRDCPWLADEQKGGSKEGWGLGEVGRGIRQVPPLPDHDNDPPRSWDFSPRTESQTSCYSECRPSSADSNCPPTAFDSDCSDDICIEIIQRMAADLTPTKTRRASRSLVPAASSQVPRSAWETNALVRNARCLIGILPLTGW